MGEDKMAMFENRLYKMHKHFSKLARRQNVACYRFYDHDLPEFPFAIEWYDGVVYAAEYKRRHGMSDDEHNGWLVECKKVIAGVLEISGGDIFLKTRQRKENRTSQYQKLSAQKVERIVPENGLSFIINLTDYLDTGLFLDHRITRALVKDESKDKNVLNLFCYTGSFSVYAASGGASGITSVDLSKTYLNWARRNMQYNKLFDDKKHHFVHADAIEWLKTAPTDYFDLVICDPPTFSNSKRMDDIFDVQRDHVILLKQIFKATKNNARIYFSNNYRGFTIDRDKIPAQYIKDITANTTPFDFQGRLHRKCFLIEK